ncbi:hypothetical protein HDU97_004350 [Phlyctochytrium planicorne]|nr:hypothetical protein HDU97_004350 [Phlyctochytrium planicorne]
MKRVLVPEERAATAFYFNFDNMNLTKTAMLRDLGPLNLDLVLGQTTDMKFGQERLMPKFVASTAPVKNAQIVVDAYRATAKFNGTYTISDLVNATVAKSGANITVTSLFPADYGLQLFQGSAGTPISTIPVTFPALQSLVIVAQSNEKFNLVDGNASIPIIITSNLAAPVTVNITVHVKTPKPIDPGSAGSALYCDGRRHAYAKDFSFGPTTTTAKFTIEFWAYQFFILPLQTPSTVYSIGNSEISAPGTFNWCFAQSSDLVPNDTFCRGRLLMDLPSTTGYLDAYSGWNPDTGTGLTGAVINSRYGTWYHVAFTADGTNITIYLNGEKAAWSKDYGFIPNPENVPLGLFMCSWPFWGKLEHNYKGFIDEFRIWNVSRTQAEIKATKDASIQRPSDYPVLISYYNFDEYATILDLNSTDTVKVAKDLGSSGNDLVFGGCVPNRPPYCRSTAGVCSPFDLPRVPCYTDSDDVKPQFSPTEYISSAPISGYSPRFISTGGMNITIKLSSSYDGIGGGKKPPITYTILKAPSLSNGILYSSDGKTQISEGMKLQDRNLLFVPIPGRGGNPLDVLTFSTESQFYSSNRNVSIKLAILCANGTYLTSSGDCVECAFGTYNNRESFATSCESYKNLTFYNRNGILLTVMNTIGAAITLVITFMFIHYRKAKIITAASPLFCCLILAGCLLGHASVYTFTLLPKQRMCFTQPIMETFAYTLVMTNIGIKTFRIHRIFSYKLKLAKKDLLIRDYCLIFFSIGFLAIDAVILAAWLGGSQPPRATEMMEPNGNAYLVCSSESPVTQSKFITTIVVYKVLLTLCTLYLGMKVRYITSTTFNESRYIVLCIYTISIVAMILVPLVYITDSIVYYIRQLFAGIITSFLCTSTAVILFGPKLLHLWNSDPASMYTESLSTMSTEDSGKIIKNSGNARAVIKSNVSSAIHAGDGYIFANVMIKPKAKFTWEHVDLVVLPREKCIMARRFNQSIATYFEMVNCDAKELPVVNQVYSLTAALSGQQHVIRLKTQEQLQSLLQALKEKGN